MFGHFLQEQLLDLRGFGVWLCEMCWLVLSIFAGVNAAQAQWAVCSGSEGEELL